MPVFEPAHWVSRGFALPARTSEEPTGTWASYAGRIYVAYRGNEVVGGYPRPTRARFGSIASTADGITWSVVWDGQVAFAGHLHCQPLALWVHAGALHAVIASNGRAAFFNMGQIPAGEIFIVRTTTGTLWTKVASLHAWPAQDFGDAPGAGGDAVVTGCAWVDREGDARVIVGWNVGAGGPGGSFTDVGTDCFVSPDGLAWSLVRHMRGSYPFTSSDPSVANGPSQVVAITPPTPPGAPERWFMIGGQNILNYSDNQGATWTASVFFTQFPFTVVGLKSRGMAAFAHGTGSFGPDSKVSCDQGASFTTITTGAFGGPANAFVGITQFDVGGGEELLVSVRDPTDYTTKTNLWYTTNGGETYTNLGSLPFAYTLPVYLLYANGLTILYSAGRDVWTCADHPTGLYTPRTICPDLVPPPPPPNLRVPMAPCPPPFTPVLCEQVCPPEPAVVTMARMLGPLALRRQQHSAPRVFVGAESPVLRVTPLAVEDIPVGATFMNIPCAPVCPSDPDLTTTCHARLGLFQLGENCLGTPGPLSALARRLAAAGRRH